MKTADAAVVLAPRPATEIVPPMSYITPQRQFMSKTERRERALKGESTLPPTRPPYVTPPSRRGPMIWDPQQHKMVPLKELPPTKANNLPSDYDVPSEYHFRMGTGGCKVFTPCKKRPCFEDDHVDLDRKVIRWKGTTRNVEDIPFPDAPDDGATSGSTTTAASTLSPVSQPSTADTPPMFPLISTGRAPRLGPATDIMPRFQVGTDGVCSPVATTGLPRLYLRGTKRWLGQVLPSFRPPM